MKSATASDHTETPKEAETAAGTSSQALEAIRAEYTRAIGPMAHVLLDEMLADIGLTAEDFPRARLPELIEKLSWQVHSERRRVEFQKAALQRLQHTA